MVFFDFRIGGKLDNLLGMVKIIQDKGNFQDFNGYQ